MTARLGRNRRRHRKVSAQDPPKDPEALSYQWERFGPISSELPGPFLKNWEESGCLQDQVTFDVNWNHYFDCDLAGRLIVLTVRRNTVLVGYAMVINYPHPHHVGTEWAHVDCIWLNPAYRLGFAGMRMIRELVRYLDKAGVQAVTCGIPLQQERVGKLLKRYGFGPVETVYARIKP